MNGRGAWLTAGVRARRRFKSAAGARMNLALKNARYNIVIRDRGF
jgi:hypothetical protein